MPPLEELPEHSPIEGGPVHNKHAFSRNAFFAGIREIAPREFAASAVIQSEKEAAPFPRLARDFNLAAHLAHQPRRDGEPKSCAAVLARRGHVRLGKGLEDARLFL